MSVAKPEPKILKIDPEIKGVLYPNCHHWFVLNGICISCNSTVSKFHGQSIDYIDKGIQLSHEALAFTKRVISHISWLDNKKLHLVLDLDHTLLHTISVSDLSKSDKYLTEEAETRKDLWRFNDGLANERLIKLRPFVHQFLKEANEIFSMYVYTNGSRGYAERVLKFIDPMSIYFEDRIITRRECPGTKTLDFVLADECGTVIVDDKRSVWPDHKRNLLQIAEYRYFRGVDDKDPKMLFSRCCEGEKRDESYEKGALAGVLRFLKKVHKGFFSEKLEEKLESMDVRPLLQEPSKKSKRSKK